MNSNERDPDDGDEMHAVHSRAEDSEEATELTERVRRPAGDRDSTDEIRRWRERRRSD